MSSVTSGDLALPKKTNKKPASDLSPELKKRLESWRRDPNILTAAEAVETAIVDGVEHEAVRPARSLVMQNSAATALVRRQAATVLRRTGHGDEVPVDFQNTPDFPIKIARSRTRQFPRDAFAWADLARALVIERKDFDSQRAMAIALQLAPNNRHVLRAATRLFVHVDDAERAHDLLKKNAATKHDPWLMAGEIAVSALAERKPAFFKTGSKLIDEGGIAPRQLSELAAAITEDSS